MKLRNNMMKRTLTQFVIISLFLSCTSESTKQQETEKLPKLKISNNQRFFMDENGNPFFWLGDTGWLLFKKCDRNEAEKYLEDRKNKGFNVIQVMVIHDIDNTANAYGDSALINKNVAAPNITEGNSPENDAEYDFWDHVDYIIKKAEEKGLYMALVPTWGSNVKGGNITLEEGRFFANWLAERYKNQSNIIWLNGGDVFGSDSLDIWNAMGETIHKVDTNHLMTFHPRGRMISSDWFHNEEWLDFNMFQSGHRRYDQDDTKRAYGQDNWKYIMEDYNRTPVKPTLDGEPSYEGIPEGLHDTTQRFWNDDDVRRYAYWSVFAGGAGFTYGNNAIMQFHKPEDKDPAYGVKKYWTDALNDSGAIQMIHLKNLMLSKPYFERRPDQSLIVDGQGDKYDRIIATRGEKYMMVYTYSGKEFTLSPGTVVASEFEATWFNPRNGNSNYIGSILTGANMKFDPPGEAVYGDDWVLILEFF